jgi:hypothetical protein
MSPGGQLFAVDNVLLEHIAGEAAAGGLGCETASDNTAGEAGIAKYAAQGQHLDLVHFDFTRVRGMRGMQMVDWLRKRPADELLPGGLRLRAVPAVVHSPAMGPNSWKSLRRIDKGVPCVADAETPGALRKAWAKKCREHVALLELALKEADGAEPIDTWALSGTREAISGQLARYTTLAQELEASLK